MLSPKKNVIRAIGKVYAGRASISPIIDLLITLLSMGLNGYKKLLRDRDALLKGFAQRLSQVANKYGERRLECPTNSISFGMTLDGLAGRLVKFRCCEKGLLSAALFKSLGC